MNSENLSSGFSKNKIGTPFQVFDMLPPSVAKREPPAHYVRELLKEKFGDNYVLKASAKAKRLKLKLPVTTIRDVIDERHARGPSINTLKTLATVLDVDPLEFVSRWIDRPMDSGEFSQSHFAALWASYSRASDAKKTKIAEYIRMMIREMDRED